MRQVVLLALAALAACTVSSDPIGGPHPVPISTNAADSVVAPVSEQPTRILSQRDADRLLGNTGLTLQWIGWERRGPVSIAPDDRGVWHVRGAQTGSDGGELEVDGIITERGIAKASEEALVALFPGEPVLVIMLMHPSSRSVAFRVVLPTFR